jgi:acyl dehydratase
MQSVEKSKVLIPEKVVGFKTDFIEFPLNNNETIIYALSIGFNEDQLNKKHFRFTYEFSDDFSVFPTYAAVIPLKQLDLFATCPGIPDFNFMSALHGEESIEIVKPLPPNTILVYQIEIVDVEDKGKGTVFSVQTKIYGKDDKTLYSIVTSTLFVRGLNGEGVKSKGPLKNVLPKIPNTTPLKEMTVKTTPNQALYYRIGGNDPNPLHVDPDMAALGGFDKPILHGLCFYGITARCAYDLFCDDKPENLFSFKARFTSHVFPGESLIAQFWKGSGNNLIVSLKNVERGTQVLVGEIVLRNAKL